LTYGPKEYFRTRQNANEFGKDLRVSG